jgi:hypothetical protein
MDGRSVKLSLAQRRDLERLFVRLEGGARTLRVQVTTISNVTSLRRLSALQRVGLLRYVEIPDFFRKFGVVGWYCRLTPSAHEALVRELAQEAS